jgi:hypothetical protein
MAIVGTIASGIAAAISEAYVRLFGSCAKGTSRPDSDVDFLNIPAIGCHSTTAIQKCCYKPRLSPQQACEKAGELWNHPSRPGTRGKRPTAPLAPATISMDLFEFSDSPFPQAQVPDCSCSPDLSDMLTVAYISQGMDPLQAALEAQLQAPLVQPFLF